MSALASSLDTSLRRYGRSMGMWILLLLVPVTARYWIAGPGATESVISAEGKVPVLTSPMLGVSLGIVIATLLLPAAFIYLRSNVTRRQPWQVEETTAASRVGIAYGRWLADLAVLGAVLAATTAAGCLLAVLLLPWAEVDFVVIVMTLWVIAAPPLAMVASLRVLFASRRWLRGWLGEVLFFVFWMTSIAVVAANQGMEGFAAKMIDLPGFYSPLAHSLPGDNANFTIGGGAIVGTGEPIHLDVLGGVMAPGYLPSRLAWFGIAALVPLFAGLVYAPHVAGKQRRKPIAWLAFLRPGKPRAAQADAPAARPAGLAWLNLLAAEAQLLAGGRPGLLFIAALAVAGWFLPFTTGIGPASMLLLVFTASAHAGRSEAKGLLALTRTGALSPWARRIAFVLASGALALVMGAGAIAHGLVQGEMRPLMEAGAVGLGTGSAAILLGGLTRTATAPRLVLIIAWYFYLSWGGQA